MQMHEGQAESFLTDPQIADNYQILNRLGQGAMGQVYLAEQIHVGRRLVALKVLNRECAANPQLVKRFESEAATAGRIQHRNVVTIYESRLTSQGNLYVAMEYIAGRTLREELAERGALPLGEVIDIVKQACAGLNAAHKLGIVHRDVKPDNIMLIRGRSDEDDPHSDARLLVKVLDFGIARLSESQALSMHTAPGLIIGTPAYLSPEQAAGAIGNQIDARADIYSLGMVIYEMLTGRVAFQSDSWLAVVRQQLYDPPPAPSRIGTGIPPNVEQVVMQALEKDRERRPQTVSQFARDLEVAYGECLAATDSLGEKAPAPSLPVELPRPAIPSTFQTPRPARESSQRSSPDTRPFVERQKNWTARLALSVLALTIFGAVLWMAVKRNGPPPTTAISDSRTPAISPTLAPLVRHDVMTYRITRKQAVDQLRTLPLDLRVHSEERVIFEFKLSQPGEIYLMAESGDHSWRWLDAAAEGKASVFPAGRWIETPRDSWYVLDDKAGTETFWVFYIPRETSWSLAETIAPAQSTIERGGKWDGTAVIYPPSAERVLRWFKNNAAEMKASGKLEGDQVQFSLWHQSEAARASFHRIELKHIE